MSETFWSSKLTDAPGIQWSRSGMLLNTPPCPGWSQDHNIWASKLTVRSLRNPDVGGSVRSCSDRTAQEASLASQFQLRYYGFGLSLVPFPCLSFPSCKWAWQDRPPGVSRKLARVIRAKRLSGPRVISCHSCPSLLLVNR